MQHTTHPAIPEEEKNRIWDEIAQTSPDLIQVFLSIKDEAELKAFFRDLMSERDLREFAMRWEVAKRLDAGETYKHIQEVSGQAMDTISKISRWLKGGCGGYRMMIDRFKKK
ncbi:MAG: hypothetical protein RLY57_6 [Candidatus Parcubacteria bacterium]|jgi:TrpR-related protein YerC/YecD